MRFPLHFLAAGTALAASPALAQSIGPPPPLLQKPAGVHTLEKPLPIPDTTAHAAWVAESLKAMQKIKAGMTRAQLLKVFTGEGGLSTRTDQVYVYRQCAYFKVRVHFKPVGKNAGVFGSPDDRITRLSEPFLQWSVGD